MAELARSHEREPGNGARQRDDRSRTTELDDREAGRHSGRAELGQIARQPRGKVVLEAASPERTARIEVVVARYDRHTRNIEAEVSLDDAESEVELLLERQVREVSGDDDVIDPDARNLAGNRPHVLWPMNARALQAQVGEARHALV